MDKYIGRLLDNRYEILEVIGTGGMAVVYKARCHRLNRLVAIKILKDDYLEDEDFRRRFHSESQAVAMLSHPNIVSVYDVSTSVMVDYIVMELIEGISLKQYMEKKGVLNWKETLHFAMQIGKALEHAHSRGIVHRDIKPHNVMVLKNGSVKVTDFGIARLMSKGNTLTKEALGSVHYISPEQAKGGQVDDRSDIYSLGVVMYEMMSGRPPYDGETPVSVAIQHINGGAAMPSTMNPNIPGGLEQIIMKAMANDRAKRFAGATEMLRDMDEFRKDPAILFDYNGNSDEVIRIHKPITPPVNSGDTAVVPPVGGRTTAQRVADRAGGVSPAKRARDREAARRRKEEEERRRNRVAVIAISVCSAVIILAVVIMFIVFLGNGDSSMVEVPNLLGERYRDSMVIKGLSIGEIIREPSDEPRGTIIKQDPRAGTKVELNTKINLTISEGEGPQLMENLANSSLESAKKTLDGYGLNLDIRVEYEFNNSISKDYVISTDPAEGEQLQEGQEIVLVVSMGNQPAMENLEGLTEEYARKILDNYGIGLQIVVEEEFSKDVEKGRIIRTEPREGDKLDMDQEIILVISQGDEPIMPDFEDVLVDDVRKWLGDLELDLDITVEEEYSDEIEEDHVIKTIPGKDAKLEEGQEVTLVVSKGAAPAKVPGIVGMSWLEAKNKLEDAGFKNYDFVYKASLEKENVVIDQSEAADTEVPTSTQIIIYLSDGSLKEKNVDVTLPQVSDLEALGLLPEGYVDGDVVTYRLTVSQGSTIIYDVSDIVLGDKTYATLNLISSGKQTYDLKIDGVFWKSIEVDFTA